MFSNQFVQQAVSRRSFLIGAGMAAGALPLLGSGLASAAPLAMDTMVKQLETPAGMLELYIKMSGDTSGKNYGGWYSGHAFAIVPGAVIRPVFGFTGFGIGSDHRQPDGSFHHLWKEVGFYTDLETGEVLDRWTNPMNGEVCDVMPIHNRSVNLKFTPVRPDLSALEKVGGAIMNPNFAKPSDPARPYGFPYSVIGDQIAIFADSVGRVPNPLDPAVWKRESAGPMIDVGEFFMLNGSLRDAMNPKLTSVKTSGSWTRIGPFLPWMLMGQAPGHLFYRSSTAKITGPAALPAGLRAVTKERYPEFLEFPTDFATPIESSWEVYKREHQPHA